MSDSSSYDDWSVSPWSPNDPIEDLKERLRRMEKKMEKVIDDFAELKDVVQKMKLGTNYQESKKKEKEEHESFLFLISL